MHISIKNHHGITFLQIFYSIHETKWKNPSLALTRSFYNNRFMNWKATYAEGALGGILIIWDKRLLQLVGMEENNYALSYKFKNVEHNFLDCLQGLWT